MNRFGSHPNPENRPLYEGPPVQGLSEAWRTGSFFVFQSPIRRGGAPSGAVVFIVMNEQSGNNLPIIVEYYDFHKNYSETRFRNALLGFRICLCSCRCRIPPMR